MNKKKGIIISALATVALTLPLAACGMAGGNGGAMRYPECDYIQPGALENYRYDDIIERDFTDASETPDSYFSLDRNTASYSLMRRTINEGRTVGKNSVRIEEYINYFDYDYARPQNGDALAVNGSLFDCPWNDEHKLLTVEVAAETIDFDDRKNNIVFLIDTSGSMYGDDRLGLIQQSFTMLTECLDEHDTVSIVTYAGDSRIALDGESGANKTKIANVLQDLEARGSTFGQGGIENAYKVAERHFTDGANNRVILATDGDFNVGASSKRALERLIRSKRETGIYLSVLGVGMYNTNDTTMKTLAENGNGNYAYLDSVNEARKVLVKELGGTFNVVAKDAKIGVTFDAEAVDKYRLIGYESKMLTQEEFEDEKTDAGEIGSGHTVTALYELALKPEAEGSVAAAEVRYKTPNTEVEKSVKFEIAVSDYTHSPDEDHMFIACVAEYGLVLRESKYAADASLLSVVNRLDALDCTDASADPFKAEFLGLAKKALRLYGLR